MAPPAVRPLHDFLAEDYMRDRTITSVSRSAPKADRGLRSIDASRQAAFQIRYQDIAAPKIAPL